MGTVLTFPPRDAAMFNGDAFCFGCRHTWTASAPEGVTELECPACHAHKGLFRFPHVPAEGTLVWVCNCGNEHFNITPEGVWCPNCGKYATFPWLR